MSPLDRVRTARRELELAYLELSGSTGTRDMSAGAYVATGLECCDKAVGYLMAAASGHIRAVKKDPRRE